MRASKLLRYSIDSERGVTLANVYGQKDSTSRLTGAVRSLLFVAQSSDENAGSARSHLRIPLTSMPLFKAFLVKTDHSSFAISYSIFGVRAVIR